MLSLLTRGSVLRNTVYARMLTAYSLSTIGDYFDYIALMILLGYSWHLSPLALALYPIMYALPGLLLGQFTGVFADRARKLHIMIAADLARCTLTILLIFAPNVWAVYPILLVRGAAAVFNTPATQALTREVVAERQLLKATSYNRGVFQFTKIFAPFVGGSVAAVASPYVCLWMNGASFAISAIILGTIRMKESHAEFPAQKAKAPFCVMWREGWHTLLSIRVLLRMTLFYLLGMMMIQIVESQYTTLFRDVDPTNLSLRGWFTSSIGLGAFLAVVTLHRAKQLKRPWLVLGGGILLEGVMCALIGRYQHTLSSLLPMFGGFLGGVGSGFLSTGYIYLVQRETPKEFTGRVFGILSTLFSINVIVGPLIGGTLVTSIGPSLSFQLVGVLLMATGAIGLSMPRLFGDGVSEQAHANG